MTDEAIKNEKIFSIGDRVVFESPYDKYKDNNGRVCTVIKVRVKYGASNEVIEVGMYGVMFDTGEQIDAWPEELVVISQGALA